MKDDAWQWWLDNLEDYRNDGRKHAEQGVYSPPHAEPEYVDPQDQDENAAYSEGWWARRKELGNAFRWQ